MQQAMDQIRELQAMRGLLPEWELASRARAIFERADMKPIDLTDFLADRGYANHRLAQAVGTFGKAVKTAYTEHYGHEPMRVHVIINGDVRPVAAYIEADRELIEHTFAEWSA